MLKQFKKAAILSSLGILLPIPAGLILWNRLPGVIATHWGPGGQADGWTGKGFAVFALPLILLAVHWLGLLITSRDPGHREQSRKPLTLIFWLMPVISVLCCGSVYAISLGWTPNSAAVAVVIFALMFIVLGNYMPKTRQNYTFGIKIKWALENEENWNATHRFGGRLWVICGILALPLLLAPFAAAFTGLMLITLVAVVVPVIYSWKYHKKQVREGSFEASPVRQVPRWAKRFSLSVIAVILVLLALVTLTGTVEYTFGETSFTVATDWYADLTVDYSGITAVEYRERVASGVKVNGFNSFRLLLGGFKNDEFGTYTRYTVNNGGPCVVLRAGEGVLVLSAADEAATRALYDTLLEKTGK